MRPCMIGLIFVAATLARSERTEEKWLDLTPDKDLSGWKRAPIPPDSKLSARNPWKMDANGKILICDGVGIKEMLIHEKEFTDGVYHVEWRFRKVPDKKDYNGGIYIRTSADGKIWHQAQVAHLEKAPRLGDLFGETLKNGNIEKFLVEGRGMELAQPPGDWNTFDITFQGPKITVAVNGAPATIWNNCRVTRGHVGLQAEFFYIEFKNLKFKSLR
jgi:hypothetical protein